MLGFVGWQFLPTREGRHALMLATGQPKPACAPFIFINARAMERERPLDDPPGACRRGDQQIQAKDPRHSFR